jgi:tRNA pseudouridine55 synthase
MPPELQLDGVLVIDKPAGMTSADVVARVKAALGAARAGHTGTLDPMATGVLPIALGEGTKVAPFLLADDKGYEGELELGLTTTTLDVEGEVVSRSDPSGISREAVAAALAAWVGEREQLPPAYSALHVGGKRAYALARAGKEVELQPRRVRIDRCELLDFTPPRARFAVECGKGTYVRSLVRDVGEALGCGATLTALRRTRAGRFDLASAVALASLDRAAAAARIVDPAAAIAHLPAVSLDAESTRAATSGKPLPVPSGWTDGTTGRLLTPAGALVAVVTVENGRLRYVRGFNYGLT